MPICTLWIMNKPAARYLRLLEQLPETVDLIVGDSEEAFQKAPRPDAVFCGIGMGGLVKTMWPRVSEARWMHSFAAGLESILFPELVASPMTMSNAKGVFGPSLGEFAIASALYFAKDLRRMVENQAAGKWDPFDVEELAGATLGIVGYGGIGREAAKRAKAMGMKVLALRRHPGQSAGDGNVDAVYAPAELDEMVAASDYLVVSAPNTAETRGMIGEAQLRKMKKTAVLINVGRGPVVVESALIQALEEGWIKGASLDVFDEEPLPEGHAFYRLKNVLLSPHCADHTPTWLEDSMQFFVDNCQRFLKGEPLENVVDKSLGY
ncbi:MAG: D-2-hydroxyacid dehydrogenase [Bryobacterales bacterium]|nr:D-2-hydroxyacid dehydrogenase [Bryobacterales bacterium]